MVRDLIIDIKEHDLEFDDKSSLATPTFSVIWGNIFGFDNQIESPICNIIVPYAYWSTIKYDDNNELTVKFQSPYYPNISDFRVRLVGLRSGQYSLFSQIRGEYGLPAKSFALSSSVAASISPAQLPFIDISGSYLARFLKRGIEALDRALIYSGKLTDIKVDFSDDQASQLLSLCAPGKNYRYPTTGAGITGYLNTVVDYTDIYKSLEDEFLADKKPLRAANFDSSSGELQVRCIPEEETEDSNLEDADNLNDSFFTMFDDEYVRKNIVISESTEQEFMDLLNQYDRCLALVFFKDSTTTVSRIADTAVSGKFDAEGNIVSDSNYLIVSATLEANTIVMCDDELEDQIKGGPVFIVNDQDQSRLYTSLVEQPYWITEECHKAFVLRKRSTLKYMIRRDKFLAEKGLYSVPQTSANIKNMLGVVQDVATGRVLGLVSNLTNINEVTMEELTRYIWATQIAH